MLASTLSMSSLSNRCISEVHKSIKIRLNLGMLSSLLSFYPQSTSVVGSSVDANDSNKTIYSELDQRRGSGAQDDGRSLVPIRIDDDDNNDGDHNLQEALVTDGSKRTVQSPESLKSPITSVLDPPPPSSPALNDGSKPSIFSPLRNPVFSPYLRPSIFSPLRGGGEAEFSPMSSLELKEFDPFEDGDIPSPLSISNNVLKKSLSNESLFTVYETSFLGPEDFAPCKMESENRPEENFNANS